MAGRRRSSTREENLPRAFGDYALLEKLGEGGMGAVYLAKRFGFSGIEQHCVVKTLRPSLTGSGEYIARFTDEARVVVQLNHRNICHVSDIGVVDGQYYLAMELIAGQTVRALWKVFLERGRLVPPHVSMHIIGEMLEALDYAHRHTDPITGEPLHIVHRDVSPQNAMVNYEGELKLIDFGLTESTLKVQETAPNLVVGKIVYMAPEQASGLDVDGRCDLYAAGIMLYELLAGERFYADEPIGRVPMLLTEGGHVPRKMESFDADLRALLGRALAPAPRDRFPTCAAFREALLKYQRQRGLEADASAVREIMAASFPEQREELRSRLSQYAGMKSQELVRRPEGTQIVRLASMLEPDASPSSPTDPVDPDGATVIRPRTAPNVDATPVNSGAPVQGLTPDEATQSASRYEEDKTEILSGTTSTVARPPRPAPEPTPEEPKTGRAWPWAAGVFVVAVVAAVLVGVSTDLDSDSTPTPTDAPSASDSSSRTEAERPASKNTTASETPSEDQAAEPNTEGGKRAVSDEAGSEANLPKRRRPARRTKRQKRRVERQAPPPPVPEGNLKVLLDDLQRHCLKRVPCAADLIATRRKLALMGAQQMRETAAKAKRCAKACRR